MISGLLLYKILQLFAVMVLGFAVAKLKVVKSGESMLLSKLALYLLMPAAIINAFDMEITGEIVTGVLLSFAAAIALHIVLFIIDGVYKKCGAGSVERASVMYPNAGNIVIPIVSFVLGPEWVIYSCAYFSVQLAFIWTHGINLFSKEEKLNIKKILFNPNIIAIAAGVVLMIFSLRLPVFVKDVASSLGGMLGNVGMLIAGMLAAEVDFKKVLKDKRLYIVTAMRMIICPLILLAVLKGIAAVSNIANTENILLISFLACMTPSAATVLQFAQINNTDVDFAVSVNIITTVACIATMPLLITVFQII